MGLFDSVRGVAKLRWPQVETQVDQLRKLLGSVAGAAGRAGVRQSSLSKAMSGADDEVAAIKQLVKLLRARDTVLLAGAAGAGGLAAGGAGGYFADEYLNKESAQKKSKPSKRQAKIKKVMGEFKRGTLRSGSKDGPKVTSRAQAQAIAISEAEKVASPPYTKILTQAERAECIRSGMILKSAQLQLPAAVLDGMCKEAQLSNMLDAGTRAIVVGSLITGIPMGIMAHVIGQKTKEIKQKEKALKAETDYYGQAARELETGLAQQGVRF